MMDAAADAGADAAAERKRKRLEAWRKRQLESAPAVVKVSLSLATAAPKPSSKKPHTRRVVTSNPFGDDDDDDDDDDKNEKGRTSSRRSVMIGLDDDDNNNNTPTEPKQPPLKKRRRWDSQPNSETGMGDDALDKFMETLQADGATAAPMPLDASGSMMRTGASVGVVPTLLDQPLMPPLSGGIITPEQLEQLAGVADSTTKKKSKDPDALYSASDWESDAHAHSASETETDDEEEELHRRKLIEALKSAPGPQIDLSEEPDDLFNRPAQLAAEVKTEKQRREDRLRHLEKEAQDAKRLAASESDFGRIYNDGEGGVMEEAERNLNAAMAAPDALEVLAELNKKKELKAVDHSKVDYIPFKKNLYIVPRAIATLTADEVADRRAKLKVKVRGPGAPAPVSSFEECGLSERLIGILANQEISTPFPVQAQCIPCIMAGRDVIGIAKTGSGKTLAYLLPLLRHIGDQPPLGSQESGPIGLILAPARELASQIHAVCKFFSKHLNLK